MKKFLFGLFVGCFCSICGFYVVSGYIPQKMQDVSHVEKSAVEKPALSRPVKKESEESFSTETVKIPVKGCFFDKQKTCFCYLRETPDFSFADERLTFPPEVCENYIKFSSGSKFVTVKTGSNLPPEEEKFFRNMVSDMLAEKLKKHAISNNRSAGQR